MRLLLTILTGTLLLFSCEKQKEQVAKFVFDSKQIASRQIHTYEFYEDGKIKADNSITYYYLASIPFDTVVSKSVYKYTSKGKVESIVSLTDSTKRVMTYSATDSLIGDFRINKDGDTTFLLIHEYQYGKRIKTINRMLSARFPARAKDIQLTDFRNYDTLLFVSENIYYGDQLEKSISKDAKGNVTGESQNIYEDGRHVKTITYSYIGNEKYMTETTNYIYGNQKEPDFLTTDTDGDTVSYQKTIFQDDMRIVTNYFSQTDSQDIWYYNKQNQLIGNINLHLIDNVKYVNSYKYDDQGNCTEETSYKEKLSNPH
ncbi:MAG: hypothetical protein HYZ44_16935 [Bacteroidetes bacterium]|nr:hypothetical protein [Bacteroidota bacterium]